MFYGKEQKERAKYVEERSGKGSGLYRQEDSGKTV